MNRALEATGHTSHTCNNR